MTLEERVRSVIPSAGRIEANNAGDVTIEGVYDVQFDVVALCALTAPTAMMIERDDWGCPTCGPSSSLIVHLVGCRV
jgi:hypothetical protein